MTSLGQRQSRTQSRPRSRSQPPIAAGDPAARIAALFDAHCGFVCRVLRHLGVHEAALDDAVQDVFVTAYRRWSSFEGRSSPRSWLYGIARRIAFRQRRSADARARRFVAASADAAEGIDEPFDRAHAAHSLTALLRALDADKRTVFVLIELEGMTAPEVAEALGIPLGTAYSRLRAAWQALGLQADRERQRLRRALPSMRPAEPSAERRRHMWSLVAGGLGLPSEGGGTAAATGWLAQAKWLVVGVALGAGLLGARAAVVASRRAEGPAVPVRTETDAPSRAPASGRPAVATEPVADEEPPRAASRSDDEPTRASRRAAPQRPRTPAVEPPGQAADPDPDPASEDSLTAELALLQRARQALRDGRADDALEHLAEHARRFPRGQLADERRVLEEKASGARKGDRLERPP